MTNNVPENRARQATLGRPVLFVLLAALLLAIVAWGVAEVYGVLIKDPSTDRQHNLPAATSGANPAANDPVQSKTDTMNSQPVDRNPEVDKNPTPQTSTGGDQQGTQPSQPAAQ